MVTGTAPNKDFSADFLNIVSNRIKFRLFLLKKLPAAFFSSIAIVHEDATSCSVSVPFGWRTQNPFRSTYFACLSMAAEMSTGVLAMANVYKRKPAVSMLIVATEAKYHKKATDKTIFTCTEGEAIKTAVERAITGEAQTIKVLSTGKNKAGEVIAEFWFTWSFKVKF